MLMMAASPDVVPQGEDATPRSFFLFWEWGQFVRREWHCFMLCSTSVLPIYTRLWHFPTSQRAVKCYYASSK